MKRFTSLLIALVATAGMAFGSALNVTNVTVNQPSQTVSFDIQWRNSWRITAAPANWDAVWVFIKWRPCGSLPSVPWNHAAISTTIGEHAFSPAGELEFTNSAGTPGAIDAAPNNTGGMLRRATLGVFATPGVVNVTFKTSGANAIPTTGDIDVKVIGIEMVYVPQGAYILGDGEVADYKFTMTNVTSEAAATYTAHSAGSEALHADYPKGFAAFYCMKYEITQGQYAEFLNTLTATASTNRYLGFYDTYRNRLGNFGTAPNVYGSDRPDRAQNYMNWADVSAYLDWACLRPMTEMEYEKATRGEGLAIVDQYAWGTTYAAAATTINQPAEDGTEEISNAGANCNSCWVALVSGDGNRGPLRAGIFAKPASNSRVLTGATYYGIMEMSGNTNEIVIATRNDRAASYEPATTFLRSDASFWGDGNLAAAGTHDQAAWPPANMTVSGTLWQNPLGWRGGGYYQCTAEMQISYRYRMGYPWDYTARNAEQGNNGGRGVR